MKGKGWKQYAVGAIAMFLLALVWFGVKPVGAALQTLESITAYYTGDSLKVGEKIDIRNVAVSAMYTIQDAYGTMYDFADVKTGFTLPPATVEKKGTNEIVVSYRGKTALIYVEGKTVESITAQYMGDNVYTGTPLKNEKFEVYAYFSDGTFEKVKDFTLSSATVEREGVNTITVTYAEKTAVTYVYGIPPLAVEELFAYYLGEPIIEGGSINKKDVEVTAFYNDGSMKKITNFTLTPGIVEHVGENDIVVSYGDISTTIQVFGLERYIVEMEAEYVGAGVEIGEKVKREDVKVTVTYNDGTSEITKDFDLYGEDILWEGENVVIVYCDSFMADVMVYGLKGFTYSFDNCISAQFLSADYSAFAEVTLGMNLWIPQDKFFLRELDAELMERVVQRAVPTEQFMAFELAYDDDEMILEFPMSMKVSVPDGWDPERFAVYYTPNQETIMAKVQGKFADESMSEFQFVVYEPGAYIIVNEIPSILVTDIIIEEEVKLRVNRNYSLTPVVFPLNAENKDVTYWSSDESVATVSEKGKIKTHSEGTCEIWIEAADESGVYTIVTIKVSNK